MSPKLKNQKKAPLQGPPGPKVPGKPMQDLYKKLLKHRQGPAFHDLIEDLTGQLEKKGLEIHPRTVRRQLEGQVRSVPQALETAIHTWVQRRRQRGFGRLLREFDQQRQQFAPPEAPKPQGYVDAQALPTVVDEILRENPLLTRRQLALLLREELQLRKFKFSLNTLQFILAGKTQRTRSVLLEVLQEFQKPGYLDRLWSERRDLLLGKKGRPSNDLRLSAALAKLHQAPGEEKKALYHYFLEARQELIRKRWSQKHQRKTNTKTSRGQSLHDILNEVEPGDLFGHEGTNPEDAVVAYDVGSGLDRLVS
jgi:hypothetical protein